MLFEGFRRLLTVGRAALAEERVRPPQPQRSRDETEFLPAVVEVLEMPALPTARAMFWSLSALLAVGLAWSFVGEHLAKLAVLDAETARRRAEQATAEIGIAKLEQALPLLKERQLAATGNGSRLIALEVRQQLVEMRHEPRALRQRREDLAAGLEALLRQRQQTEAEYAKTVLGQRVEAERKIAGLGEELRKAEQRRDVQTLTAPIGGVVQQLAVHTLGGVVTPAQALMAIVPAAATLEVEAQLANRDIGFVQAGQDVELKLETFMFTRYGTIPGKVVSISRDAVQDEKKGLLYPGRIALLRDTIDVDGRKLPLRAGMALTAEIKTDHRKVIDYLLSPIRRYAHDSLRER